MTKEKELFSHFASVLPVGDMGGSIEFYRDKLGFELTFSWNNPVDYAVLKRGDVGIHLTRTHHNAGPPSDHTSVYIFVHDVVRVYEEFKAKGVETLSGPTEQDYKMQDFDLKDPEGHILTFGQNSE